MLPKKLKGMDTFESVFVEFQIQTSALSEMPHARAPHPHPAVCCMLVPCPHHCPQGWPCPALYTPRPTPHLLHPLPTGEQDLTLVGLLESELGGDGDGRVGNCSEEKSEVEMFMELALLGAAFGKLL